VSQSGWTNFLRGATSGCPPSPQLSEEDFLACETARYSSIRAYGLAKNCKIRFLAVCWYSDEIVVFNF